MASLIFLFPGQSSRDPEMLERLRAVSPAAASRAEARIRRARGGPNLEIQGSVLAMDLAYLELAEGAGLSAVASAGMSLGEYAHLVHIGALDADDAFELICARGRAYDEGPDGVMIALTPAALAEVEELLRRVRAELGGGLELVCVSNVNGPSQLVIAGRRDAVERASELAEEELYAVPKRIEDRIPMHSPRFAPVATRLFGALDAAPWRAPRLAYWPNVLGEPLVDPSRATIVELLARHVVGRVEWERSIDGLIARHPDAVFVEVGPRRVLSGAFGRRWHPGVRCFSLDPMDEASPATFSRRLEEIRDALA